MIQMVLHYFDRNLCQLTFGLSLGAGWNSFGHQVCQGIARGCSLQKYWDGVLLGSMSEGVLKVIRSA